MAALGVDAAVFQDQNAVRFTHGGHPLGDYHQGSAGEIPPQRLPQRGGCGVIQGAVGIVQYQDLRPVRQGPGISSRWRWPPERLAPPRSSGVSRP